MAIQIKEHLDHHDFLEANFPHALKPFYKKRLFIVNIAFAVLYLSASIYIFIASYKNHVKLGTGHFMYLFFGLLFGLLSYYLIRREKRIYNKLVDDINDLETVYTIEKDSIKVDNKKAHLSYKHQDLQQFTELDKWLVFEFNNAERIAIYKPNISEEQLAEIRRIFE